MKYGGQEGSQCAKTSENIQENIGRKLVCENSTVVVVTVRGRELGLEEAGGVKGRKEITIWTEVARKSKDKLVRKTVKVAEPSIVS